jgi:hypothetical protein
VAKGDERWVSPDHRAVEGRSQAPKSLLPAQISYNPYNRNFLETMIGIVGSLIQLTGR